MKDFGCALMLIGFITGMGFMTGAYTGAPSLGSNWEKSERGFNRAMLIWLITLLVAAPFIF